MKSQRKRVRKTKVNKDLPLSNKEFLSWVDRVLSKPINPKGIFKNKKTDWIKKKDFNPKP